MRKKGKKRGEQRMSVTKVFETAKKESRDVMEVPPVVRELDRVSQFNRSRGEWAFPNCPQ